jgi:hypothetical protein
MTIDLDLVVSELELYGLDLDELSIGNMEGFSCALLDILEDKFSLERAIMDLIKQKVGQNE